MPTEPSYPRATDALIASLEAVALPHLAPEVALLHHPQPGEYQYAHHPHIAAYGGRLLTMWSSGVVREDRPGQRVLWAHSEDGGAWSQPEILLECPEHPWRLTAGGWAIDNGRVYAYINRNRWPEDRSALQPGVVWYPPLYVDVTEAGEDLVWSIPRAIDADFLANESPRRTHAGTWLMAGYNARLDSAVLRSCASPVEDLEFHRVPRIVIPPEELTRQHRTPPVRPLGEPSWYQRRDGTLACFLRDDHGSKRLFASISADDGITWSRPEPTNIPDAKAKTAALVLSSGTIALVCNPCAARRRNVLAVLLSDDGIVFDRGVILRDEGTSAYGYPSAIEHAGHLWVAYSVNKHDIAVASMPLEEVLAAAPASL
jgi:hypothetical protein